MKILFAITLLFYSHLVWASSAFVEDDRETDRAASIAMEHNLEDRWDKSKPDNYYYILASKGWGTMFPVVAVYVENGDVVKVTNLHPLMNTHLRPEKSKYKTIDQLLSIAIIASKKDNEYFNLKYNSTFGYPEHISFWERNKHHGEKDFKILEFGAIKKSNQSLQ
jgi:hypothetical protein